MPISSNTENDTYPLPERRGSSIMLNGIAAKLLASLAAAVVAFALPAAWWLIQGNTDVRLKLVELTAEISATRTEINGLRTELNSRTDDRYRASDAARDFRLRDQKDIELERRLQALETHGDSKR